MVLLNVILLRSGTSHLTNIYKSLLMKDRKYQKSSLNSLICMGRMCQANICQGALHVDSTPDISLNILIVCHNGDDLKDSGPSCTPNIFAVRQRILQKTSSG